MDTNLTKKLANLAQIELSEEEIILFTQQLSNILNYIEQLTKIDTMGISPLIHPFEISPLLLEDIPRTSPANMSSISGKGYIVPPILGN